MLLQGEPVLSLVFISLFVSFSKNFPVLHIMGACQSSTLLVDAMPPNVVCTIDWHACCSALCVGLTAHVS